MVSTCKDKEDKDFGDYVLQEEGKADEIEDNDRKRQSEKDGSEGEGEAQARSGGYTMETKR